MNIATFEQELVAYNSAFNRFVDTHRLPEEWFSAPDHVAVKCADELDYLDTVHQLTACTDSDGIWELTEGGRKLASARLAGRISLGQNHFEWIEIMQPRSGKETAAGFVEHVEFYFPYFVEAEEALNARKIGYERQGNTAHTWLNVVIDDAGREIKLNNKPLAKVTAWENEQGLLTKLPVGASR